MVEIAFLEGILKITNVVLSLIAGYFAIGMYKLIYGKKEFSSWKPLMMALIFFMVQEILGALRAFGIFTSPFLTHVVPTLILFSLLYALALQMHIHVTHK